jgi:hypothetical protein
MKTILKGTVPKAIHNRKGLVYFSKTKDKWMVNVSWLKLGDISSTPVQIPKRHLKNVTDIGVAQITIEIDV